MPLQYNYVNWWRFKFATLPVQLKIEGVAAQQGQLLWNLHLQIQTEELPRGQHQFLPSDLIVHRPADRSGGGGRGPARAAEAQAHRWAPHIATGRRDAKSGAATGWRCEGHGEAGQHMAQLVGSQVAHPDADLEVEGTNI